MHFSSPRRHIRALAPKLQFQLARQVRHKFLVRIGFRSAQLVVEMHDRDNHPEFAPQFEQNAQQRDRINPAGHGDADAVSGPQQILPPDVGEHAFGQSMHGNMVQRPQKRQSSRGPDPNRNGYRIYTAMDT